MNIKEGIKRIYIVAAVLWAILLFCASDKSIESILFCILVGIILPVVIYYIAVWIYNGFVKK